MPFEKKFKNSGDTKHIRVPIAYVDLILELMVTLDNRFDVDKGKHLLKKFIHNLT